MRKEVLLLSEARGLQGEEALGAEVPTWMCAWHFRGAACSHRGLRGGDREEVGGDEVTETRARWANHRRSSRFEGILRWNAIEEFCREEQKQRDQLEGSSLGKIWWVCLSHWLGVDAIFEKGKTEEEIWEEKSKFCAG